MYRNTLHYRVCLWVISLKSSKSGVPILWSPGSWVLGLESQVPGSGTQVLGPGSPVPSPGSWFPGLGSRVLGPRSRVLGSKSWVLVPCSRVPGPGSWVLSPESWVPGPRSWFRVPGPESRVLGPYFRLCSRKVKGGAEFSSFFVDRDLLIILWWRTIFWNLNITKSQLSRDPFILKKFPHNVL